MGADRARIGRRREQSSSPEDPAWDWYLHYMLSNACLLFDFCLHFVFRLQFVFINRLLALLLIIINIGLALTHSYGIWILEHKGATPLQKLGGGNSCEAQIMRLRFEGGAQIEGEA